MAKSYYSVVLDHPANEVWSAIRPFDHYAWAGVESETIIEEGKAKPAWGVPARPLVIKMPSMILFATGFCDAKKR